jgi:hypothetical protein
MTDNNIQHPDITAAEQTGYPYFPRKVTIEATPKHAEEYCGEQFKAFFAFLLTAYPYAIDGFLDDNNDDFVEFMTCGATF